MFLGFSKLHSLLVGLVHNLRTTHVSPQFHVVYNQCFHTVPGGLSKQTVEELDADSFRIFLKRHWDMEDCTNALDEWDENIDGPRPADNANWDEAMTTSHPY